jgi:sugar/nucleoside kinase (ribokinase family)
MAEAIVAGHLCLDIIPSFVSEQGNDLASYLAPGRLTEVGPTTLSTGGPVSNAGINLHRLGIHTQLMAKVGDDLWGQAILNIVRSQGQELAEGMIVVPGEASSYSVVIDPPGVDRLFLHSPGTNHTFGAEDVRYDLLAGARLFHFGYPPLMTRMYAAGGQELAEMFHRAKETGITTSLDLVMPDPAGPSGRVDWFLILARALPYVDLFAPSVEELLFMLHRERFDALTSQVGAAGLLEAMAIPEILSLGDQARAMGAKIVVLKLGTRGIYLRSGDQLPDLGRGAPTGLAAWSARQLWVPCFQPDQVISTVGTGDAAIAGFLAALLRDTGPELALNLAVAAGACCVEEPGALRGVRTWERTLARMEAGWARLPLDLAPHGWQWDGDAAIWQGPADRL